ncbi:MAG: hypothetical protein J5849_00770 [Clostridia bacterium]|nr:hypothetical protein [Clostridia bacterium]MBR5742840.1 hypothetical protein [Clostridia bacterium]
MTLLITVFAALAATLVWYLKDHNGELKTSLLCFMFWGASIMWLVDAIVEYAELGAEYFSPAPADMLNDAFLGLSVIALAMIVWLVVLLIKDPKGKIKAILHKKKA